MLAQICIVQYQLEDNMKTRSIKEIVFLSLFVFAVLLIVVFFVGMYIIEQKYDYSRESMNEIEVSHHFRFDDRFEALVQFINCNYKGKAVCFSSTYNNDTIVLGIGYVDSPSSANELIAVINDYIVNSSDLYLTNGSGITVNMYDEDLEKVNYIARYIPCAKNHNPENNDRRIQSLFIDVSNMNCVSLQTSELIGLFKTIKELEISGDIVFDDISFLENSSICSLVLSNVENYNYEAVKERINAVYPNIDFGFA